MDTKKRKTSETPDGYVSVEVLQKKINDLESQLKLAMHHQQRYCDMLPDNVCYDYCYACDQKWWEGEGGVQNCRCGRITVCKDCTSKMPVLEPTEHGCTECKFVELKEDEEEDEEDEEEDEEKDESNEEQIEATKTKEKEE